MMYIKRILLLDYSDFAIKDGSTGSMFEAPDTDSFSLCCCKVLLYYM